MTFRFQTFHKSSKNLKENSFLLYKIFKLYRILVKLLDKIEKETDLLVAKQLYNSLCQSVTLWGKRGFSAPIQDRQIHFLVKIPRF